MWTQFIFEDRETALELDALKSSHAIGVKVGDPAEIGQLFDAISYSKVHTHTHTYIYRVLSLRESRFTFVSLCIGREYPANA